MSTAEAIASLIGILAGYILVGVGALWVYRWAMRRERRKFNWEHGKSLDKHEFKQARKDEARKDRHRFWRNLPMTLAPALCVSRLRRAESHLGDERLVAEVVDALLKGVALSSFEVAVAVVVWLPADGLANPWAWLLLACGLTGLFFAPRLWRLSQAFRATHGGRQAGQEPGSRQAEVSVAAWEKDEEFRAEVAVSGVKPRYVRQAWKQQGRL